MITRRPWTAPLTLALPAVLPAVHATHLPYSHSYTMPSIQCPVAGCTYATEDVDATLAASLLNLHCTHHATRAAPSTTTTPQVEKVRRPNISPAGTREDWSYFQSRWSEYKAATKIQGNDIVIQLLECCDEQLRKDLTRNAGGSLSGQPEATVMAAIRSLAVREENCMVARVQLHQMRQDRDEPIRRFGARLRGKAGICKFTMKCPSCKTDVNYTDAILCDVLTRGIADPDIQLDLLSDQNQNMTLEKVMQLIEAKESGKRSALQLLDTHGVEAARSSYRREKNMTCLLNKMTVADTVASLVTVGVLHPRSGAHCVQRSNTPAPIVANWVTSTTFVGARTALDTLAQPKPQLNTVLLMTVKELFSTPYALPYHKTQMSVQEETSAPYGHPTNIVPGKVFPLIITYMTISVTAGCVRHQSLNPTSS